MIRSMRFLRSDPVTPSHAIERRLDAQLAGAENAFRVGAPIGSAMHDVFVARALALVHEARADPPDHRMKPERGLDQHVDGRHEIVAAAHVADLVREHGVHLRVVETCAQLQRPQQDRMDDAEDAGLERRGGRRERDRRLDSKTPLHAPQRFNLSSRGPRRRVTHAGRDPAPTHAPDDQEG
jgi:hypothetical protein